MINYERVEVWYRGGPFLRGDGLILFLTIFFKVIIFIFRNNVAVKSVPYV